MKGLGPIGHLEKSAIERIRAQAGADAGMSLNCCVPLELEFEEYVRVSLDNSKTMGTVFQSLPETTLVLVPTTIISAYIGSQIKSFVDRAKISVSILGCQVAEGAKIDSCEIDIDQQLIKEINRSRWLPEVTFPVTVKNVFDCIAIGKKAIASSRKALPFLGSKIESISDVAVAGDNEKMRFLNEIISSDHIWIIDACLTGALARRELILPSPDDKPGIGKQLFPYHENTEEIGGFKLFLGQSIYPFYAAAKVPNEFLLQAVKCLAYFDAAGIRQMLAFVKDALIREIEETESLLTKLEPISGELSSLLSGDQHLTVDVMIENRGRAPAFLSQWGVLSVITQDIGKLPSIAMKRITVSNSTDASSSQSEGSRFSLFGGSCQAVTYASILPLQELEAQSPRLPTIFELDVFRCKFALRRVDRLSRTRTAWVWSANATFGKTGEEFPLAELELFS